MIILQLDRISAFITHLIITHGVGISDRLVRAPTDISYQPYVPISIIWILASTVECQLCGLICVNSNWWKMTLTLVVSQYFSTLGGKLIRRCVSIHSTFVANGTLYSCTLLLWATISTLPTPRALMLFAVCSITSKGGEIFLHLGTRLHSIARRCTEIVCFGLDGLRPMLITNIVSFTYFVY